MGSIASLDDLINKISGGNNGNPQDLWIHKDDRVGSAAITPGVAARWHSMWQQNGMPGSSGATPTTTAAVCTSATAGAWPVTDATGGRDLWLVGLQACPIIAGTLMLYDRLAHVGGFDATVTTAQTCAGLTPTRYTDGKGNSVWMEVYSTIGATTSSLTVSYSNESGTSGRTSPGQLMGNTSNVEGTRMLPVPMQAGDRGITDVASATLSLNMGSAGNWGLTVVHPLAIIPCGVAGAGAVRDLIQNMPAIVKIQPGACLAWMWCPNAALACTMMATAKAVEA